MEENAVLIAKEKFIRDEMPALYAQLKADQAGRWGKMNGQQMVEHMTDFIQLSAGKYTIQPVHSPEITQKSYSFMMSEKPFRENTKNPLLPETPEPAACADMEEAIGELRKAIAAFFAAYESRPDLRNLNPIFGNLNYKEQVHLLHKHGMHHARQFGLVD